MTDPTPPSTRQRNPYVTRRVITNPDEFIGRQEELNNILDRITSHESVSIVGPRRIGKTSLLKHIPYAARSYPQNDFNKRLFVFLDAQSQSSQASSDEIYRWIWEEILYELKGKDNEYYTTLSNREHEENDNPKHLLEECIRQLDEKRWSTTLLIDEFEHLAHSPGLENDFYTHLRSFNEHYKISYVISSAKPLARLTNSEVKFIHSRFSVIFYPQPLGFLTKDEAEELIRKPVKESKHSNFMNNKKEFLFDLAGFHPAFLQIACYELFKHTSHEQEWDEGKIKKHYATKVKRDYSTIWDDLNDEEKKALTQINKEKNAKISGELEKSLGQKCLIYEDRLFCVAFSKFVTTKTIQEQKTTFPSINKAVGNVVGIVKGQYRILLFALVVNLAIVLLLNRVAATLPNQPTDLPIVSVIIVAGILGIQKLISVLTRWVPRLQSSEGREWLGIILAIIIAIVEIILAIIGNWNN